MATRIPCAAQGCNVVIEDASEAVALARFSSHLLNHSSSADAGTQPATMQRAPKMDRPTVSLECSEEVWSSFKSRWQLFKKCTVMKPEDITRQLFLCCDEELGNNIFKVEPSSIDGDEESLLTTIKRLAVIPVAISVRRADLLQMKQAHGETIRSFYAKVKGKAMTCSYTTRCACNPSSIVDFTTAIIRDVVVAGLADTDISKEVLSEPNLDSKSITDVVCIIESKEMARNACVGNSSTASVSGFQKQKNIVPQQQLKRKTEKCPECSERFELFTEGLRGWNSKPHKVCIKCWKKSRSRQRPTRTVDTDNNGSLKIRAETNGLLLQLGASESMAHTRQSRTYSGDSVQLDHHIFSNDGWKAVKNLAHPMVQLRMTTKKEDYDTFGATFPKIAPLHVQVITDTGAQSCLWSRSSFDKSGLRFSDLLPVTYGMLAANKSPIRIDGAILLRLEGRDKLNKPIECAVMVYVSPDANGFYLSNEAMAQLGIIGKNFPQVGSAFIDSTQMELPNVASNMKICDDGICDCPKRMPPPGPPAALPFPCCPENNERMQQWLLTRYAASTFNTCPHQPLPGMAGPPIKILVDPDATPTAVHTPATIPIHWQDQVERDLRRDEDLGVIERVPFGEPVTWCHRMVITRKHDGGPRRTVDLSPLNKHCSRETHGAKSPFQLARSIPPGSWKTVTDAWNGYHSVPIREEDRHLTTFITPHGRWRYIRAPQGFLSSGDGYNRRFDEIVAEFVRKQRCVDDTLHFDEELDTHWWRTIEFLDLVGKAGIVLNPKKFQFAKRTVDFAGFRISNNGVEPLPKYIDAIRNFPTPASLTDVRSWFGLVNQVSHYAQLREIMAPFKPLLSSSTRFMWTEAVNRAFEESKHQIIEAIRSGVEIFDINRRTCLRTDWSKTGIGYYLSQQHCKCSTHLPGCCENGWRITLAGSRFLSSTEQRYAAVEGEMLSVAWGLEQTKYFTQGCDNLLVVTDHKPLVKLLGDRTLDEITNTRLFRLKQRTLTWRFEIVHQPGKDNHVADATSRHPTGSVSDYAELANIGLQTTHDDLETAMIAAIHQDANKAVAITWQQVKEETLKDETMTQLVALVENGFPTEKYKLTCPLKQFWEFRNSLFSADGIIFYKDRIVIPPSLRDGILKILHSAHQGVTSMTARAKAVVFWPGITSQIQKTRDQCYSCNRNAPSHARMPPIAPIIPSSPFEAVFADFFNFKGRHYIVLGDRLSGWTTVHKAANGTSESGAKGLCACLRQLFVIYGVPEELSSDGGPEFTAGETRDFLNRWGIRHRISSAHHPQSNGRAELAVKATKRLLEANVGPNGDLNTDNFVRAMLTMRNTPDPDCKLSPAQILLGRTLRDAMPMLNEKIQKFNNKEFRPMWQEAWEAKENALRTRYVKTMENLQEHCRSLPPLRHGDKVYVQNQEGNHPKKWDRSGMVVECREHDQYIVKIDGTGRLTLRNRKFLRRYEPHSTSTRAYTPPCLPSQDYLVDTAKQSYLPHRREPMIPQEMSQSPDIPRPLHTTVQNKPPIQVNLQDEEAIIYTTTCPSEVPSSPPRRSNRPHRQRRVYDAESGSYVLPNT